MALPSRRIHIPRTAFDPSDAFIVLILSMQTPERGYPADVLFAQIVAF